MKKVLFVATVVRLHLNTFHKPYIKWFHDQGWQVDVASRNDYDNPEDCVIPYCDNHYDLPFERSPFKSENLKAYKELKKIIETEEYDIIHCHTPVGGVLTRLAANKMRKSGKTKILYTAHGFHFYKGSPFLNWAVYYPIEKLLSRRTDMLITMNQEDYEVAKTFKANSAEYVNGVGLDLSKYVVLSTNEKNNVREKLGLKENDIFAITVGNLIKRKNHSFLLKAVKKAENERLHLFICGDGECYDELKNEADYLGINNNVHFLGFRNDVNQLCGAADLFLFSSVQEGLPVSVMEAMAVGLPVIAFDIRGNKELIDNGEGGYLVDASDLDSFVECMNRCSNSPKLISEMKAHNLKKIQSFGIEEVVNQMSVLYKRLM